MYTIEEGYTKGLSLSTMARELHMSRGTIAYRLQQMKLRTIIPSNTDQSTLSNPDVFDTIDSHDKAYWLGFIMADGSLSPQNSLKIGLAELDVDHLVKLSLFLPSQCSIGYNKRTRSHSYAITNKHLAETLRGYGIVENKSNKQIDYPHLGIYHRSFLCGYIDGDGSIGIHPATSKNGYRFPKLTINAIGQKPIVDMMYQEFGIGGVFHQCDTKTGIPLYVWQTASTDYTFIESIYPKQLEHVALTRKYNLVMCFRPLREKFRNWTGELTENAKLLISEVKQANSVQKALGKINAMRNE